MHEIFSHQFSTVLFQVYLFVCMLYIIVHVFKQRMVKNVMNGSKKKCMFHINGCMNIVWTSMFPVTLTLFVNHIYDFFIIVLSH